MIASSTITTGGIVVLVLLSLAALFALCGLAVAVYVISRDDIPTDAGPTQIGEGATIEGTNHPAL